MKWAVIAAAITLAGCTTTEYVDRPIEVRVPVPTPCRAEVPPRQRYAADTLRAADTDFEKIKALLVERRQRAASEDALRELLKACTEG